MVLHTAAQPACLQTSEERFQMLVDMAEYPDRRSDTLSLFPLPHTCHSRSSSDADVSRIACGSSCHWRSRCRNWCFSRLRISTTLCCFCSATNREFTQYLCPCWTMSPPSINRRIAPLTPIDHVRLVVQRLAWCRYPDCLAGLPVRSRHRRLSFSLLRSSRCRFCQPVYCPLYAKSLLSR